METENSVTENVIEEVSEQTTNRNMKPCKVCGKAIAKKARTCPYCGAKNKKSHKGLIALLIIIALFAAVAAIKLSGTSIISIGYTSNDLVLKIEGGEEISTKELEAIYNENQAKFKNNYQGKAVSFIGTVKEIKYDYGGATSEMSHQDRIIFEEKISLTLHHGDHDDVLNNLSRGDKLSVSSEIQSFGVYGLDAWKIRGLPWHDESIISIVKE